MERMPRPRFWIACLLWTASALIAPAVAADEPPNQLAEAVAAGKIRPAVAAQVPGVDLLVLLEDPARRVALQAARRTAPRDAAGAAVVYSRQEKRALQDLSGVIVLDRYLHLGILRVRVVSPEAAAALAERRQVLALAASPRLDAKRLEIDAQLRPLGPTAGSGGTIALLATGAEAGCDAAVDESCAPCSSEGEMPSAGPTVTSLAGLVPGARLLSCPLGEGESVEGHRVLAAFDALLAGAGEGTTVALLAVDLPELGGDPSLPEAVLARRVLESLETNRILLLAAPEGESLGAGKAALAAALAGRCPSAWPEEISRVLAATEVGAAALTAALDAAAAALPVCLDQPLPATPAELTAGLNRGSSVELRWWDRARDEAAFRLEWRRHGDPEWQGKALTSDSQRHLLTGLEPGRGYELRLRACADAAAGICGAPSATLEVETLAVPAPPSGLELREARNIIATISWRDNSSNEERFEILWQHPEKAFNWVIRSQTRADVAAAKIRGLKAGAPYLFSVRACNLAGCSEMAEPLEIRTEEIPWNPQASAEGQEPSPTP